MVGMVGQERRNQDGGVEEPFHRDFFRRGRRVGGLPMKLRSRSRRIWRSVSSVAPAGIGSPTPNTQIPCFWCSPTPPLRGRSTMRSSELSSSSESPARSCSSSRTGLGKTTLPALSSVKVVVIDVIIQWHLALKNAIFIWDKHGNTREGSLVLPHMSDAAYMPRPTRGPSHERV